jgi:glutamate N-acetyltransferase/amino-acid N-acetyltransferase
MAVTEDSPINIHPVSGFRMGVVCAGIKTPGRKDLVLMELSEGSHVAAVFTSNDFCAAPVQIAKKHLAISKNSDLSIRYLLTNTGNANAGTGQSGIADALSMCERVAENSGVELCQVLPFSTGVIGEPLPVNLISQAIPQAIDRLSERNWPDAAEGILTTDTRPKAVSKQIAIKGQVITVSGIAKGAGMIKPNMATMLAYIVTDVQIEQPLLDEVLVHSVEKSFNRISVDGDTSTNDSVVLAATGTSGLRLVGDNQIALFRKVVESVCVELAKAIVRDGEGATKFVEVTVDGGASNLECLTTAYAIAESPLVKTALFASDPNWGRVLAAVGRAGLKNLKVENIKIWFDEVLISEHGGRALSYTEALGQRVMGQDAFTIRVNLGRGEHTQTVWTTDLSYEYIRINAEYRT